VSENDLRAHIGALVKICHLAGDALGTQFAHLKLQERENEGLRKKAFGKEKGKKRRLATGNGKARHLTSKENIIQAGKEEHKAGMKEVHKLLKQKLRAIHTRLAREEREVAKAKIAAEKSVQREAAAAARRATRGHRSRGGPRGGGTRGGRGSR
jgi:hypothetical protein